MVKETPECWRNWEVDYGILVHTFGRLKATMTRLVALILNTSDLILNMCNRFIEMSHFSILYHFPFDPPYVYYNLKMDSESDFTTN